jgi:hypothetical protein
MPPRPPKRPSQPAWPALDDQLAASKVVHGTALEQLIRDNQDFSLLRPEEANDNLRLPPWLRVYWRKQHPESTPSPGDPTGGYPLALRDVYLWMIEHQNLEAEQGGDSAELGDHGD